MFAEEYTPTRRGFDNHYGYYQGAEGYFDHTYEASEVWFFSLQRTFTSLEMFPMTYEAYSYVILYLEPCVK